MKDNNQWIKVSMVSGILVAGLFSHSSFAVESRITDRYNPETAGYDPAKVFKALVLQYSIDRRQWVDIGLWLCHLESAGDKPSTKVLFYPSGDRTLCLDARQMSVYWRGDRELFALECEAWIETTIRARGMTNRLFACGARSDGSIASEEEQAAVNRAFGRWCRELLGADVRSNGSI